MTRTRRASLCTLTTLCLALSATLAHAQQAPDSARRGHVATLALDAGSREAVARLNEGLRARDASVLPPGALVRAWRVEGVAPREVLRARTDAPAPPRERLRASLALCRMDVRLVLTARVDSQGVLVQAFSTSLYQVGGLMMTSETTRAQLDEWIDYSLRDAAQRTADRTRGRCATAQRELYADSSARHVHARRPLELRVDMLRLGAARLRVPVAGQDAQTTTSGWWALGAGMTWEPLTLLPDRLLLGAWGDVQLAWSGTRAASAVVEGGLALDLLVGRPGSLMLMGGWREGWTSADGAHPLMRSGHPMLTLRGAWRASRYAEIVGLLSGGTWLRGPLIEDPRAWWWRASVEGRLGFDSHAGFCVRGTIEGLEQARGPTQRALWALIPGIFLRY